jgi:low affinity Fe/Cu permease
MQLLRMNKIVRLTERSFEKLVSICMALLSNSFTFVLAVCLVAFWLFNTRVNTQDLHGTIGEFILGITFLSLFIIQKSFNRFSASLHLKVNELVSSHETASNAVIHTDKKTERELTALSKEYATRAAGIKDEKGEC